MSLSNRIVGRRLEVKESKMPIAKVLWSLLPSDSLGENAVDDQNLEQVISQVKSPESEAGERQLFDEADSFMPLKKLLPSHRRQLLDLVLGESPLEKTRSVGAFIIGLFTMYALHSLLMICGISAIIYGSYIFFKFQHNSEPEIKAAPSNISIEQSISQ